MSARTLAQSPLAGWTPAGALVWSRRNPTTGRFATIARHRNPATGLIEWHARVIDGPEVLMDTYTGQDLHDAVALATEALSAE